MLAVGCSNSTPIAGTSTGDPSPDGTSSGSAETSSSSTADTSTTNITAGTSTESSGPGCSFLGCDDPGPSPIECSTFEQDCPRGEKCNAWANDGGNAWNATKCVPVAPDADRIDAPCSVEIDPLSGIDSCERGAMCWFIEIDGDGNATGICVPHCSGTGNAPTCEDPNRECKVNSEGVLALCLPNCDPLSPEACLRGQGCYPTRNRFTCAPDASGEDGAIFDTCEFINACDAGSTCLGADLVGLCDSAATGCCTPYCDLNTPTCPDGTLCIPYFERGSVPPGYEDVGVCGQDPG